uniref:(northern house mosquito) hypothetical protein n=1 Tax=Culex pipiens TaxID=7175 RepID=A0A8D8FVX4_CULPI
MVNRNILPRLEARVPQPTVRTQTLQTYRTCFVPSLHIMTTRTTLAEFNFSFTTVANLTPRFDYMNILHTGMQDLPSTPNLACWAEHELPLVPPPQRDVKGAKFSDGCDPLRQGEPDVYRIYTDLPLRLLCL